MKYKKFYFLSLFIVFLASSYPLYMGFTALNSYFKYGYIKVIGYPKYIIPYTPICIGVIVSVALMPLIFRLFKKFTLPAVSLLGVLLFIAFEFWFEQIKISGPLVDTGTTIKSWQLFSCMATPEVLRTLGKPLYAANNPAFKVHFYIIAFIIILAVLNVIYGFSKMIREQNFTKKRPLIAQAVSAVLFISLCILACLTAFYRNGTINISPLSATLMSVFFIMFGITVGIYFSSIFYGKGRLLSIIIPAITASLTTLIMYIGELVLMGGALYKFGTGLFFKPVGIVPFSAADITIILVSGILTYFITQLLENTPEAG